MSDNNSEAPKAPTVWVPSKEEVHTMMGAMEEIRAQVSPDSPIARKVAELDERLNTLDRTLPKGQKIYTTGNASLDEAHRALGDTVAEAWRRRFLGKSDDRFQRAQTSGTDSTGGVLVPDLVSQTISRIPGEASLPELLSARFPMDSDTLKLPVTTAGPTISYAGGNYVAENTDGPETGATMDNPTLTAKTVLAIDTVSIQLTQNTIVPVAPLLGLLYKEAIDQEMNVQMFSSSNPFTGVLQEGSVAVYTMPTGSTAFSVVSFDDLLGTLNKVATKVRWRGDWVMHPDTLRYVVGLKDSQGRPIFQPDWPGGFTGPDSAQIPDQTAGRPGRLFGRPLYVTDAMPSTSGSGKPFIVYGWFKFGHAFGDHTPLAIDWSEHAGFKSYSIVMRASRTYAVKTILPTAFAVCKTA